MAFTLLKATMTQHLCVGSTLARHTWGFNSDRVQEVLSLIPCFYPILSSKLPCLCGNLSFVPQIRYYSECTHQLLLLDVCNALTWRDWVCCNAACLAKLDESFLQNRLESLGTIPDNREIPKSHTLQCLSWEETGCQEKGHRRAKENLLVLGLKLDKSSPTLIFFLWRVRKAL